MAKGYRYSILAALAGAMLAAAPAAAQFQSDGFKFLKAVEEQNATEASSLLEGNATIVNSRDVTSGRTGLHIAVEKRDISWVGYLLGKGANPNIDDKNGVTPLLLASQMGFTEAVNTLAAKGARVDTPNRTGETPLISAVHRRDIGMLRVLLEAGADPDRSDNSGRTARDYARQQGAGNPILSEIEKLAKPESEREAQQTYGPSF